MKAPKSPLQWVIDPVTAKVFFREHWEAKPLVVVRRCRDYFQSLLSLEEVECVIATPNLRHPEIRMVNADRTVAPEEYTARGDVLDVSKLYQLFGDGSSILLSQLDARVPQLAAFCGAMQREFGARFQANVYLTPGNAKAFKPHYDSHDVFVLQVANSKHWKIYRAPVTLPLREQAFDSSVHEAGATTLEFDLHAGDMVYIPRGFVHDARSHGETSLHITIGVLGYTWTDVLQEALLGVGLRDPAFRGSVPVGCAGLEVNRAQAREVLRGLLERFIAHADLDAALEQALKRLPREEPIAVEARSLGSIYGLLCSVAQLLSLCHALARARGIVLTAKAVERVFDRDDFGLGPEARHRSWAASNDLDEAAFTRFVRRLALIRVLVDEKAGGRRSRTGWRWYLLALLRAHGEYQRLWGGRAARRARRDAVVLSSVERQDREKLLLFKRLAKLWHVIERAARARGVGADGLPDDLQHFADTFREARGLETRTATRAWLRHNDLDIAGFEELVTAWARFHILLHGAPSETLGVAEIADGVCWFHDVLRLTGLYTLLKASRLRADFGAQREKNSP